jgi:hypothetical protein
VNECVYGVNRPFPPMDEPFLSKHSRVQDNVIHVGVADHGQDGVMFGTFFAGTLHEPYHRVSIVAFHNWSPWECISASRGWTVVWMAEDSPRELNQSSLSHLVSGVRYPDRWSLSWPQFLLVGLNHPTIVGCWY